MTAYIQPGMPPPPPLASPRNAYILPSTSTQPQPPPRSPTHPPPDPPLPRHHEPDRAKMITEWRACHGADWLRADMLHPTIGRMIDARTRPAAIRKRLNKLIGTRLGGYELRGRADGTGKHKTWYYCVDQS
jgi:hypothetical protein